MKSIIFFFLLITLTFECNFIESCSIRDEFDFFFDTLLDNIKRKFYEVKDFVNKSDLKDIIEFIKSKGNEIILQLCINKLHSKKLCEYLIEWIMARLKF